MTDVCGRGPDYENLTDGWFRRCGRSGLQLPAISLGCWHNFGEAGSASNGITDEAEFHDVCRQLLWTSFDNGITHFDFANNYGPPPGMAEERCGRILKEFPREELIISSKAGYLMWPGPYGDGGSRKYILESCNQSLKRLQLDHVDIFYSHRVDRETPLEETLGALDTIVRSGKAHYCGISNYPPEYVDHVFTICEERGFVKPVIHQPCYSMLRREPVETGLMESADKHGYGMIPFSPLAQGILTSKYLHDIPRDSRAGSSSIFLTPQRLEPELLEKVRALHAVAEERGQTLAQLAIQWVLRHKQCASALIGASRPQQIVELCESVGAAAISVEELTRIDRILA